jgi:hypothetical protein
MARLKRILIDLAYESFKSLKGQIAANFIVEHRINAKDDIEIDCITLIPQKIYFDGPICKNGQALVLVSPNDFVIEISSRLLNLVLRLTNNLIDASISLCMAILNRILIDLAYESFKALKGQIAANFIIEHRIDAEDDIEIDYITYFIEDLF